MPASHLSLHYHVVFSTRKREPFITEPWRVRLHVFLAGAVKQAGGISEAIGGTSDHVHLLLGLRATHSLADVIREIKAASTEWAHRTVRCNGFSWQEGFGGFTVSVSHLNAVKEYIICQEEHHLRRTFQQEYIAMLKKNGISYDERDLW